MNKNKKLEEKILDAKIEMEIGMITLEVNRKILSGEITTIKQMQVAYYKNIFP